MQTKFSRGMTRFAGSAVLATTAAVIVAMITPATASAASGVQPPTVVSAVNGNSLDINIANPNGLTLPEFQSCGAMAFDAIKLPAVLADPSVILEPGFTAWATNPLERVLANGAGNAAKTFTTPALPDGAYAVIGECLSLTDLTSPQATMPQIILVGGPLSGVGFGS
ncbi:hypothetical protein [Rhodococcus marinonascens]|uniref:hypothetical protein n=1 Tax=Rhodococcus marinonascens TaxID=38311 RepID=UPI000ACC1E1F|nr:hypothetical protein [Rhodococcus marinonascens]